jgi:DNA polymerase/3'-5' exonuclease PolX
MTLNSKIINEFKRLLKQIQFDIDNTIDNKEKIKNTFRLKNIKNALLIITKYPEKIKDGNDLKEIKGIGKGTIDRINEILKKGKLSEIKKEQIENKYLEYLEELETVHGIGRKLAIELYKIYNIKSVKELKSKWKKKEIKLSNVVELGLKYYDKIKNKIPRSEIDNVNILLKSIAKSIDKKLDIIICGSYRRGLPFSNDIDVLLVHPEYNNKSKLVNYMTIFIDKLIEYKLILDSLTRHDVSGKYMGYFQLDKKHDVRRIDIRYIPYESLYYAIMYFTGSKDFNTKIRLLAINSGYTLNEYGLYKGTGKNKKLLKANSEEDIFKHLGLEYIKPELR